MLRHPLFDMWRKLRGNARAVIATEPMWGIPFNLFSPFASVYMLALGLTDKQIGLVASIGLAFQIFFALLSGVLTDKLGRKWATFIFDATSWGIPTLIWAVSQNFTYFVIAAIFNASWRVPHISWTCLLVEDTEPKLILDVYSWIYIAAVCSAFFTPIAGLLIDKYTLVPAMRVIYIFACISMTAKYITMNAFVKETTVGRKRMEESRHQGIFEMLAENKGVLRILFNSPESLYTTGILLVINIIATVNGSFFAIFATQKLMIPESLFAYYPFARAVTMLLFFFLVMPRLRELPFRNPMLVGLAGMLSAQILLISLPEQSIVGLFFMVVLDAFSVATFNPMVDRMLVFTIDEAERARVMAIIYVIVLAFSTPFGWIAGSLSSVNRAYPFFLNMLMLLIAAVLVFLTARHHNRSKPLPAAA